MRVLWVNTVSRLGGAERSLLDLVPPLGARGHEINVACPDGPLAAALSERGLTTSRIPSVRLRRPSLLHPGRMAGWIALADARLRMRRIVKTFRPEIVHANSLAAMLVLDGRNLPPVFWHVRDLTLPPRAARWAARRARAIMAISPSVEAKLRTLLPDDLQTRIHLIENGIPLSDAPQPARQEARRMLGLPGDAFLVGMLAHFVPWKRHDRLIAAAARLADRHPAMRFVIAGDDLFDEHGAYRRRLLRQIAESGLDRQLSLSGATGKPLQFLRALDLLVHPADDEPFGRVICEAMAVGTPVIAIDRAGPHDILRHGVSGWLIDSGDPEVIAAAIDRLKRDGPLRERLVRGGIDRVRSAYDIENTAARISALYLQAGSARIRTRRRRCC